MITTSGLQLQVYLLKTEPALQWRNKPILIRRKDALHLIIYVADQQQEEFDREKLTTILFGEDSKAQRMREALMWLNRALKENGIDQEILQGQRKLLLDRSLIWIDTHEFTRRAKQLLDRSDQDINPEFVREAEETLALYDQHFLYDYSFESDDLIQWHASQQNKLTDLRDNLLEQLIQFHINQGTLAEAQHLAEIWLNSLNPGFVPLEYLIWISLKRRYYSVVQRYLALLQRYQDDDPTFFGTSVTTWRSLIQKEEEPSLALIRLPVRGIVLTSVGLQANVLDRPHQLRDFVQLLKNQHIRLVGLTGLPGVGKTRFAQQVAQLLQQTQINFSVAWYELSAESDFELLLNEILSQLRMHQLKTLPYSLKQKRFKQMVQAYPCLVVIDEATSQKFSNGEFLDTLIDMFDNVQLLLIARHLPGTKHYPFELTGFDAAQIRQFLTQEIPQLDREDETVFQALAQITGGLPLVLNWLVGFLKAQRFQVKSFVKALSRLQGLPWNLDSVITNYEYILNWLWYQLWPDEKNILYTISMFDPTAGVSLADVLAIAESAFILKADSLQRKFDQLVEMNLLQKQSGSDERYILHPITYAYIQQQTEQIQQMQRSFQVMGIQCAYIRHFLDFVSMEASNFWRLDLNKTNILRMFEVVLVQDTQPEMRQEIVVALNRVYEYLEKRGLYIHAEQLLANALILDDTPNRERVRLLYHRGQVASKQSLSAEAEYWFIMAWDLAQQFELIEEYSFILRDLGRVCIHQGAYNRARTYLESGQTYAMQYAQWIVWGQSIANLAAIAYQTGEHDVAENYLEQIIGRLSNLPQINQLYEYQDLFQYIQSTLGLIAQARQEYQQAEQHLQASLTTARLLNNPERIALVYLNLGSISYNQSEFDAAFDYFVQGGVVAEHIQHSELLTWFLWNKAAINVVKHEHKLAQRRLQAALNEAKALNLKPVIPYIFIWFGILYFSQKQLRLAQQYFKRVFEQTALNPRFTALALYGLGLVTRYRHDLEMQDNLEDAVRQISHTLKTARIARDKIPDVRRQDIERAHTYFQVALEDLPSLEGFYVVDGLLAWLGTHS